MIQNSRYFFYGSPATYALVGQEDQHIWLVLNNLELAKFISQAFESKITTVIFDLTTFENYTPELIDNSVCFNWKVPINVLYDTSVLVTDNKQIKSTVYTGLGMQLKSMVDHDILLLPANRCQDLQQQLMCVHNICEKLTGDKSIFTQIKEIVVTNLELEKIELELYNLANKVIAAYPHHGKIILAEIGRFYE